MTKEQEQAIHKIAQNARDERRQTGKDEKKPYEVRVFKEDGSSHKTTIWAESTKKIIRELKKEYRIGKGAGCTIKTL